jgi:hypothetical protein
MHRVRSLRRDRDEHGSLIVAVGVIMVLALLSAAVVARTLAGLHSSRQGQDFSAALASADAGLSDALFRVDQTGIASASTFCIGPKPSCVLQSLPGSPSTQYVATADPSDPLGNTYIVRSKGMINGQLHAIQATIVRSYQYPFAIFSKTVTNLNGNSGNYNPTNCTGPIETVDANGNTSCANVKADLATDGQIVCTSAGSPAAAQDFYKGGGTTCQNGYLLPGTYNPQNPVVGCPAPPNLPTTPCFPATDHGSPLCPVNAITGMLPASLLPGNYLCTQADVPGKLVQFPIGFTIGSGSANNGQVALFIIPTDGSNITVSIADTCNWQNPSGPCANGINFNGDPTKLAVYLAGGTLDPGNGMTHSGNFDGIMWAPNAVEANASCNATWRGSVVVNSFTCNGGTHLDVKYDTRMLSLVQEQWSVTNYTEIPSTQVVLP